jgi:hypothetical protein
MSSDRQMSGVASLWLNVAVAGGGHADRQGVACARRVGGSRDGVAVAGSGKERGAPLGCSISPQFDFQGGFICLDWICNLLSFDLVVIVVAVNLQIYPTVSSLGRLCKFSPYEPSNQ